MKKRYIDQGGNMGNNNRRPSVFISYRRANGGAAFAFLLHDRLTKVGVDCFYDMKSMRDFSDDFDQRIVSELKHCDYVLALLSPGCFTERAETDEDYFLKELRVSHSLALDIICLPISADFNWRDECVPSDLQELTKLNLMSPIRLEALNNTIEQILLRLNHNELNRRPLMLHRLIRAAEHDIRPAIVENSGEIITLDMDERWLHARRVSLFAIGCQGIITRFFSTVHEKYTQGVEFRFMSLDPMSSAADDVIASKINSARYGRPDNYLEECVQSAEESLTVIAREPTMGGSIEYRLSSYAPTCTIQWVECENPCESYVFIEILPLFGQDTRQDFNASFVAQYGTPTYEYYIHQFELCWEQANRRMATNMNQIIECEFCELNREGNDYILLKSNYWTTYLADNQNYPGRLIIPLNRHTGSISSLTQSEWDELHKLARTLERVLTDELGVTNFNWTCLMNGGYVSKPYHPHVHMHVIPRYDHDLVNLKQCFRDKHFGNHYTLSTDYQITKEERLQLSEALRSRIIELWK